MAEQIFSSIAGTDHPFNAIKFHTDGLSLSICGCAGQTKYYVPRELIDYISSGRLFFIKTMIVGIALFGFGLYSQLAPAHNNFETPALIIGLAIIIWCLIQMVQTTLIIHVRRQGTFYSTKCCNSLDSMVDWYRGSSPHLRIQPQQQMLLPPMNNVYQNFNPAVSVIPLGGSTQQQGGTTATSASPPLDLGDAGKTWGYHNDYAYRERAATNASKQRSPLAMAGSENEMIPMTSSAFESDPSGSGSAAASSPSAPSGPVYPSQIPLLHNQISPSSRRGTVRATRPLLSVSNAYGSGTTGVGDSSSSSSPPAVPNRYVPPSDAELLSAEPQVIVTMPSSHAQPGGSE